MATEAVPDLHAAPEEDRPTPVRLMARNPGNKLLAALPDADRERLGPDLECVRLSLKDPLYEPNEPISHVYFPIGAVVSLLQVMADGQAVEVATVGNEGMVGVPVFLGTGRTPGLAMGQIAGEAWQMEAEAFRAEVGSNGGALRDLVQRYTEALFVQIAQSTACNRLHSMEERCARWLLQTHDRVGSDEFALTQEFLGQMLGVRRASVTVAAGMLQKAGFISYRRGRITIVDRKGLESSSCECYRAIRDEYDRMLG